MKTRFKRFITTILACVLVLGIVLPSTPVSANDGMITIKKMGDVATIVTKKANVREGASMDSDVIHEFYQDDTIAITGRVYKGGEPTEWYCTYVSNDLYGGKSTGYIYSSTFTFDKKSKPSKKQSGTYVKDYADVAVITASAANVREWASTTDIIIHQLYEGDTIAITGRFYEDDQPTDWYRVYVNNDVYGGKSDGFIHRSTFRFEGDSSKKKDSDSDYSYEGKGFKVKSKKVTTTATDDVYVRSGPKTTYDIIGTYHEGATVKITGQVYKNGSKACWVQVDYKGETGYVCTDYLDY